MGSVEELTFWDSCVYEGLIEALKPAWKTIRGLNIQIGVRSDFRDTNIFLERIFYQREWPNKAKRTKTPPTHLERVNFYSISREKELSQQLSWFKALEMLVLAPTPRQRMVATVIDLVPSLPNLTTLVVGPQVNRDEMDITE